MTQCDNIGDRPWQRNMPLSHGKVQGRTVRVAPGQSESALSVPARDHDARNHDAHVRDTQNQIVGNQIVSGQIVGDQIVSGQNVHFPIFVNLDVVAPLVIGDAPAVMVVFAKFSDGRGFTIGRQLRTDWGFAGTLIASGDVIADQADYLRRCGFSHAEIDAAQHPHWQFNLQSITTRFQHMAGSPRTRGWAG